MKQILPKQAPIRLEQQDYQKLREQVLRRDGWRCQLCGSMTNLEVHHKQFRSHSGGDRENNLMTLCFDCHAFTQAIYRDVSRKREFLISLPLISRARTRSSGLFFLKTQAKSETRTRTRDFVQIRPLSRARTALQVFISL